MYHAIRHIYVTEGLNILHVNSFTRVNNLRIWYGYLTYLSDYIPTTALVANYGNIHAH